MNIYIYICTEVECSEHVNLEMVKKDVWSILAGTFQKLTLPFGLSCTSFYRDCALGKSHFYAESSGAHSVLPARLSFRGVGFLLKER